MNELLNSAFELIQKSKYMVALTGAGISTASGIPDFRSPNSGLWGRSDPFEVASIYSFKRRPQDFYEWIHPLAELVWQAQPNPAHLALAQLEAIGQLVTVITQNVDMLHEKAGSKNVLEVHGHLRSVTCMRCYTIYPSEKYVAEFIQTGTMKRCENCDGILKPDVILIGEQLPVKVLSAAKQLAHRCDLMLVAGSSLEMAPAGDLPELAVSSGAKLVIINLEPTHLDPLADILIRADVVEVLPRLIDRFNAH